MKTLSKALQANQSSSRVDESPKDASASGVRAMVRHMFLMP